jgi:hypothetical protein
MVLIGVQQEAQLSPPARDFFSHSVAAGTGPAAGPAAAGAEG